MRSRILLATLLSASCFVGAAFALFQPLGSDGSDDRPSGRLPAQSEGVVASAESGASEASAAADTNTAEALAYWPQWRGPLGTGVAPHADPPIRWSEDQNVRWKIELPGKGHSTPIVWGDYVFLTAAVPYGDALPPRYSDRPGEHDNRRRRTGTSSSSWPSSARTETSSGDERCPGICPARRAI